MIRSLDELQTGFTQSRILSVAVAQDTEVLSAVEAARRMGIAEAILIGDEAQIRALCAQLSIDTSPYTIVHEADKTEACRKAVELVRLGKADVLMKGIVDTAVILREVLRRETGLRQGRLLSHVALFEVPGYDRLLLLTDAAMNVAPNLEEKRQILENVLTVSQALGMSDPIVAAVCALEKVNPNMPATLDAAALAAKGLPGCQIVGPLALDNAISEDAARRKGIPDPRAGHADILLMPDIEAGNVMYKALIFLARARSAGIVVGARAPIVLPSRADSDRSKLFSIALALHVAAHSQKETQE